MPEHKDEELLIGYVLEALDEDTSILVAARLRKDGQFRADYQRLVVCFRPLLASRETEISRVPCPTGLASKTLAFLRQHAPVPTPALVCADGSDDDSDFRNTCMHQAVSFPVFPNYPDSEEETTDYPADVTSSPETVSIQLSETRVSPKKRL